MAGRAASAPGPADELVLRYRVAMVEEGERLMELLTDGAGGPVVVVD